MALPIRSHLRLSLAMALFLLASGTVARFVFMLWFVPANSGMLLHDWFEALWLGLRFDLRVALLTVLPIWAVSSLPYVGKHLHPPLVRKVWWSYWMVVCFIWALSVIMDAGHYSYLSKRLSSTLLSLARDVSEAVGMVWQSYPVLWIVFGLLLWLLVSHLVFARLWHWTITFARPITRTRNKFLAELAVVLCALFLIHGKFSQYPLRWSDTVVLSNAFSKESALNPMHNLFDTWTFRVQSLSDAQMRPDADVIREFVGLPPLKQGEPISFLRTVLAKPDAANHPPLNVVLVQLESFAAHKVGAVGSPMGATPSFDALAKDGLLFTHMMSAHAHTARGVFTLVTGMPDVSQFSTASRNPAAVSQHSIINEFKGYKKFYFIGGSTSWANVRGVLTENIDGIDIYEQDRLKSPVEDVWGISDKNLFLEANALLRQQEKPFFAYIQTSSNHRPYTIPNEDKQAFAPRVPADKELAAQGFISKEEYLGFAYLDWCIGQFMQQARKEKYFDNTIFAFVGDHGIIGATGPHFPRAWQSLAITQGHTPLLIYAPKYVAPRRVNSWAQQVDVLPTLASLVGIGYRNTTLGRDLLDPTFDGTRIAFEFQFTGNGESGVLVNDHLFVNRKAPTMFDIYAKEPTLDLLGLDSVTHQDRQQAEHWAGFARAYSNAALFLQTHNPRFHD